jgi:hypothetical protein
MSVRIITRIEKYMITNREFVTTQIANDLNLHPRTVGYYLGVLEREGKLEHRIRTAHIRDCGSWKVLSTRKDISISMVDQPEVEGEVSPVARAKGGESGQIGPRVTLPLGVSR